MISRLSIERAAAVAATLFLSLVPLFAQYPGSKYYPVVEGSSVTFHLKADAASEVKVFGDFLPGVNEYGLGGSAAMTRSEDGMWTYTATGLAPEFYFYYFEVDGVRVLDPWNLKVACNYSEFYNTFLVEGAESTAYDYAREGKGSVETRWYDSPEYGGQRRLNVYLPSGYSRGRAYPVLYMLPGGGDDEDTWIDMGRLPQIMDHLIASGECVPMVVVMVNSMPNQLAGPHVMNPVSGLKSHFEMMGTPQGASGGEFCNDMVRNIIPFVESEYSVLRDRDSRTVCGVSMGGVYEMYLLEHHTDLFGSFAFMGSGIMGAPGRGAGSAAAPASGPAVGRGAGSVAGSGAGSGTQPSAAGVSVSSTSATPSDPADAAVAPLAKLGCRLMWIGAGASDMALRSAQNLMSALDRASVPYTYYDSGDGHNWRSWRRDLLHLAPLLFR